MNFNTISEQFGPRFKQVLKRHHITQSKFGDDTNTHKGLISRYINGESPSGDFIMKAVAYFPDDLQFLFFGDSEHKVEESPEKYGQTHDAIIKDIESSLNKLKRILSQN